MRREIVLCRISARPSKFDPRSITRDALQDDERGVALVQ